jgi:hypothetical protein
VAGACQSGPDLSATGDAGVVGVPIDLSTNHSVSLASVALSNGVVLGSRAGENSSGQQPQILKVGFEPPGIDVLFQATSTEVVAPEVAFAPDAFTWVYCTNGSPDCQYAIVPNGTSPEAGAPKTVTRPNGAQQGSAMGLAADEQALYVAVLSTSQAGGGFVSPDESTWPGTSLNVGTLPGDMFRIARDDGGVQSAGMGNKGFAFGYARHLVVQDARYVYTVTADSPTAPVILMRIAKSSWAAGPTPVATIVNDASMGVAGLAYRGSTLAWTAAHTPRSGTSGCAIGTLETDSDGGPPGPIKILLQATTYSCWGLALDATHAYFTVVHAYSTSNGSNGGQQQTQLVGTRIGRVPLAGGSPEFMDVGDAKYYGPRRVLVDDTFVYGIDPRVVLRFRKDVTWSAP